MSRLKSPLQSFPSLDCCPVPQSPIQPLHFCQYILQAQETSSLQPSISFLFPMQSFPPNLGGMQYLSRALYPPLHVLLQGDHSSNSVNFPSIGHVGTFMQSLVSSKLKSHIPSLFSCCFNFRDLVCLAGFPSGKHLVGHEDHSVHFPTLQSLGQSWFVEKFGHNF